MTYKTVIDQLYKNSTPNTDTGCWEWSSYRNKSGYGTIKTNKKMRLAHRVSYSEFIGAVPDGMCVLHKCDNRGCINPDHLFIGTNYDNVQDKVLKNRAGSKLTPEAVYIIRDNSLTTREFSSLFGVSESLINLVKAKKIWKHL